MATINYNNILLELLNELRSADILSLTERGLATKTDSFTAAGGAQTFTLTETSCKNVRWVKQAGVSLSYGTDYAFNYSASKNISAVVVSKSLTLGAKITISYDYGTGDKIYPDFARCFTESAEVLTLNGFKKIKDISNDETILTYNIETDHYEYQSITSKIKERYVGEMIRIKNLQLDTLVTPNHRFVIRDSNKLWTKKPFFRDAKDLKIGNRIIRTANWKGQYLEGIELLEDKKKYYTLKNKLFIPINKYVALLGIYLAEGNVTKQKSVMISQYKEDSRNKIKKLLDSIGLQYSIGKDGFNISDYRLYNIFKEYGANCYSKHIPREIKNLPPKQLEILLEWMILGDGSYVDKCNNSWVYGTTSKQLADDVEEITLKVGRPTKHKVIRRPLSTCDFYLIKIYSKRMSNMRIFRNNITNEYFDGWVYCVSTPNSTIVVRDNNKVFISGNSDISISSFPRISFNYINGDTEVIAVDGVQAFSPLIQFTIYDYGVEALHTKMTNLRQFIKNKQQGLYYSNILRIVGGRPYELIREEGKNKIYKMDLDVKNELNIER